MDEWILAIIFRNQWAEKTDLRCYGAEHLHHTKHDYRLAAAWFRTSDINTVKHK